MSILLPFLVFFPMLGGLVGYALGRKNKGLRDNWACVVTFLVLAGAVALFQKDLVFAIPHVFGLGIHFDSDPLRIVLAILTSFVWFMTTMFSKEYFGHYRNRNRYYLFMLITLGATLGVFLSSDLFTTIIFFEIMSFTSFVLVIHDESKIAIRAAQTYLSVALIGGLVTLMGLFMLYSMAGTLDIDAVAAFVAQIPTGERGRIYAVGVLILFGFGAKAGVFPMHIWLPEAHPVAPAPASALLSAVLTKSGVYGMIVLGCKVFLYDANWGNFILMIGVITMFLGAMLAVFSVNLKRTLACSSLSQIGFIAVAIGMQGLLGEHNALAANGTVLHIVNHSLLKLVLFMAAGVVYMNLHQLHLNDIRGWGRDKKVLHFVFIMGLLGITCLPLWNGYISKTLIHESIVEYIVLLQDAGQSVFSMRAIELLFLFSGGLTFAYMLKLYIAIFIEKRPANAKKEKANQPYMNKRTTAVLLVSALILPVLGMLPYVTMDTIAAVCRPFMGAHDPAHAVHYFTWVNLKGAVITVVVGSAVYFLFIRTALMRKDASGNKVYVDVWPEWLSLENKVYRPLLLHWLPYFFGFFARAVGSLTDGAVGVIRMLIFNDDNGRVVPPEDKFFTVGKGSNEEQIVYREGFAKSLLLIGVGLTVAMLYILV